MNLYGRSSHAYTRMEMEDPEEMKSRKAQFLIYKSLEKADNSIRKSRRPSWLKVKIFRLKVRFGRKMKKLKRSLVVVRGSGVVLQQWKRLVSVRQAMLKLPNVFSAIQ